MQILALDSTESLVLADQANKYQNYRCIECGQTVRLRRGLHRKAHYYHSEPNRICRQHAKGMPHLMLQYFLKYSLPEGECQLECQFPSISRIADVAWHPKRLIYEIQCSPISAEEIKRRNESYASIGYQVVWIFHDKRYNQYRLSSAENFVCNHPHYFTNMDQEGNGIIYDQFSLVSNGKRIHRLPPLPINPASPKFLDKPLNLRDQLPPILHQRAVEWSLIFKGDIVDCSLNPNHFTLDEEVKNELLSTLDLLSREIAKNMWFKWWNLIKYFFDDKIARPYNAILNLMLERASR